MTVGHARAPTDIARFVRGRSDPGNGGPRDDDLFLLLPPACRAVLVRVLHVPAVSPVPHALQLPPSGTYGGASPTRNSTHPTGRSGTWCTATRTLSIPSSRTREWRRGEPPPRSASARPCQPDQAGPLRYPPPLAVQPLPLRHRRPAAPRRDPHAAAPTRSAEARTCQPRGGLVRSDPLRHCPCHRSAPPPPTRDVSPFSSRPGGRGSGSPPSGGGSGVSQRAVKTPRSPHPPKAAWVAGGIEIRRTRGSGRGAKRKRKP